jgi:hypothetical protein
VERVTWLDRDRGIILWRFEDHPVFQTVLDDFKRYQAHVSASEHSLVHTIVDLSAVATLPRDVVTRFPAMMEELPQPGDSAGIIAVVHSGLFVRSIMQMFSRFSGHQFTFFRSLDAAHQYLLEQIDPA